MVRHLDTRHSAIGCGRADIAAAFARTVWHAETPLVRTAAPMLRLRQRARCRLQGGVTGEADEVFAATTCLAKPRSPLRWRRLSPARARARWSGSTLDGALARRRQQRPRSASSPQPRARRRPGFAHQTPGQRAAPGPSSRPTGSTGSPRTSRDSGARACQAFARWQPMARDQYTEAHTLMSGYLLAAQGDHMAMAASIEGRYPFLDPRGSPSPPPCRAPEMRGLREKLLLRQAFAREAATRHRPTHQAALPLARQRQLLRQRPAPPWVRELLSEDSLREAGLFDAPAVARLSASARPARHRLRRQHGASWACCPQLLHRQFVRAEAPAMEPS